MFVSTCICCGPAGSYKKDGWLALRVHSFVTTCGSMVVWQRVHPLVAQPQDPHFNDGLKSPRNATQRNRQRRNPAQPRHPSTAPKSVSIAKRYRDLSRRKLRLFLVSIHGLELTIFALNRTPCTDRLDNTWDACMASAHVLAIHAVVPHWHPLVPVSAHSFCSTFPMPKDWMSHDHPPCTQP